MMKVLIINAPLSLAEQAGNSSLAKVGNLQQPLGIAYIGAILEKAGFEVVIYDCPQMDVSIPELRDKVAELKPKLIGFSCTTLSFNNTLKAASLIKKALPETHLIVGGPHVAADPKGSVDNDIFELGVTGEAEYTFLELAERIRDGKTQDTKILGIDEIKGVVYSENGAFRSTPSRGFISDLDELPIPARHLLPPLSDYKATIASSMKHPVGSIMSSRGCPAQCKFCDRTVFGNRFRAHSPKRIADEMELLVKRFGAKEIKFWDDTFTLNKKRVYDLCEEIYKRKIKVVWACLTRVDAADYDLYKAMKKAGCWQVLFGLEHGNNRMLEKMKKGFTIDKAAESVRAAKKAGLNVRGSFVVGYPGETKETMQDTLDFAKSIPLDVASFYVFTPYHGTQAFQELVKEGKIRHNDYDFYHEMIDPDSAKLAYVPDGLTEKEIALFVKKCYSEFFLRPSYIMKQIMAIRNLNQIKGYWDGAMAVIGL